MSEQAVHRPWTDEELAQLIAAYSVKACEELRLAELAVKLGRDKANICRKARSLGLTDPERPKVVEPVGRPPRMFATDEELRAAQSAAQTARLAANGHPRGMLGKKHSQMTLAVLAERSRAMWADPTSRINSPELAQVRSDALLKRIAAGQMNHGYTRAKGGRRADLNDIYFRSSWEANYARYLRLLVQQGQIIGWDYEPKTFIFESIKRGNRAYTPDFLVRLAGGRHEWHEVKGWMDASSRVRIERMRKFYPEEILKVIDAPWFRQAVRSGLARTLFGWEGANR